MKSTMSSEQLIEFIAKYNVSIVVSMFVFFVILEMIIPLSRRYQGLSFRWFTNLSLTLFIILIYKFIGPLLSLFAAVSAEHLKLGLLNHIGLSLLPSLLVGIALMDLKQYLFHRLMHQFNFLWRVHRVHHSDIDIDLTTGFRFHPVEAILSALADILVITIFGITAEVILLRYILIFFANFFTHGNISLPPGLDRYLQWVLVTPSMHHLHHALDLRAANSNFGVLFSFWDRIFGTYMSKHPKTDVAEEETGRVYGLQEYREPGKLSLVRLILMPFKTSNINQ